MAPEVPAGVGTVTEAALADGLYAHPEWRRALPWLAQGITSAHDMSLFGTSPTAEILPRWASLRDALGGRVIVHARQVHGADVHLHGELSDGILVVSDADGHATSASRTLLAVSVADCVPISIVAAAPRAIALLHGGWRGVAAGILERGVAAMQQLGAAPPSLHVHLGPAICGACYEVGPEVFEGLRVPDAEGATHADVRATLAGRALALGVPAERITISSFCTRHGESPFYSHRGGCRERQVAVLGLR